MKYLSKFLPIKSLDQIYKALVRSHLDYCDTIYHIPSSNSQINLGVTLNSLMEKVERTQYQAALVITGTSLVPKPLQTLRRVGMGDILSPSLVKTHSPDTQN